MPRKIKLIRERKYERKTFCGECLREIDGHWLNKKHVADGTPICPARPARGYEGTPIEFEVDHETNGIIESSGLDPRVHAYWTHHPAADGNKPYKRWKGAG